MSSGWVLAVDLGTSNTAAAYTIHTRQEPQPFNLSPDSPTMPSAVYIESPDDIDVGEAARNSAESNPSGFLPTPKRMVSQTSFLFNGYEIPSSAPLNAIIQWAVDRAVSEHNGTLPDTLVLTHPQAWTEAEKSVLREAAESLNLPGVAIELVPEPIAAAFYYSAKEPLQPGERIAVVDLGGGTVDVAVLEKTADNAFNVVATRGDGSIGGRSFDTMLRRWVDDQLDLTNPELLTYLRRQATPAARITLDDRIRRAKELLSQSSAATISVPPQHGTEQLRITRTEFENLISSPLRKIADLTEATLRDAGITNPSDIKSLYLTGGSSRIPILQETLKAIAPVATLDNPKTVTAEGAIKAINHTEASPRHPEPSTSTTPPPATAAPFAQSESSPKVRPQADFGASTTQPTQPQSLADLPTSETESKKSKKGYGKWIALGAVAAVVIAVGLGNLSSTSPDNGEATPSAETRSSRTVAPSEAFAVTTSPPSATQDLSAAANKFYDTIPPSIRRQLDKCFPSKNESSGVISLSCTAIMNENSAKYFTEVPPGEYHLIFFQGSGPATNLIQNASRRITEYEEEYQGRRSEDANGKIDSIGIVPMNDETKPVSGNKPHMLYYANLAIPISFYGDNFLNPEAALRWINDNLYD